MRKTIFVQMLTISKSEENLRYIFYTIAIVQELTSPPQTEWISRQHIIQLVKTGQFASTAQKLSSLSNSSIQSISLFANDITALVSMISFINKCFIHNQLPGAFVDKINSGEFDPAYQLNNISNFYTSESGKLISQIKSAFASNQAMTKAIGILLK